ncbi:MAG: YicC/YloC family endoribonuclease [Bacteroidales bacterium]
MIKSMTGFGKAEVLVNGKKIIVEIKSLNSKQFDISSFKIPLPYREKELELRNVIAQSIQRGKVDLYITTETEEAVSAPKINQEVFKSYLNQIKDIASDLDMPMQSEPLVQTILRLPEIFNSTPQEISDEEWSYLFKALNLALDNLNAFRDQEGKITEVDLSQNVKNIQTLLNSIEPFEEERIETLKGRITENLEKLKNDSSIDQNRFEQELIYYMEKLDINEEKVRLKNHCSYFLDTMKEDEPVGRKLGFISQEMGREINTLGSKANHADIQKIVVKMKDSLEKIKEQLLNAL